MNKILFITFTIFLSHFSTAEEVVVDALENSIGLASQNGKYKHIKVERGAVYEISVIGSNAVFNSRDGAKMQNVGVMFVEPPRKMVIKSIDVGEKIFARTEGNFYFFFVDDSTSNTGSARLMVKKVTQSK